MSQTQILSNVRSRALSGEYWNLTNGINLDMDFLP
jgi:hypothetical protein